jgi:hypothetical protein
MLPPAAAAAEEAASALEPPVLLTAGPPCDPPGCLHHTAFSHAMRSTRKLSRERSIRDLTCLKQPMGRKASMKQAVAERSSTKGLALTRALPAHTCTCQQLGHCSHAQGPLGLRSHAACEKRSPMSRSADEIACTTDGSLMTIAFQA